MHQNNRNKDRYDIDAMLQSSPTLSKFIIDNPKQDKSINFSDPKSIKALNSAILKHYYEINYWEFAPDNLCPAIPGRAEYIHIIADILQSEGDSDQRSKTLDMSKVTCLDIGTGASCIYPILGIVDYGWSFIATEVNKLSLKSAKVILNKNPQLAGKIKFRLQHRHEQIFKNVINDDDRIDISMCNPPFHSTKSEAQRLAKRKVENLNLKDKEKLNFAGIQNELIYPGGEMSFIKKMIKESRQYKKNIKWFTTLVSKEKNLKTLKSMLKPMYPSVIQIHEFKTGNKVSRILAWSFDKSVKTTTNSRKQMKEK